MFRFETSTVMRSGKIARQTFHRQCAQALLEQSAEILYAIGNTRRLERNVRLDFLVHRDRMKIDVQDVTTDRRVLTSCSMRHARALFAGDLELDENVFAGGVTEHQCHVAPRDLKRLRLVLPP